MSAKKQDNELDAVRDAVTGYAVVVLAIVCFVLALAVVMSGVRVFTAITASSTTAATTTVISGSGAT